MDTFKEITEEGAIYMTIVTRPDGHKRYHIGPNRFDTWITLSRFDDRWISAHMAFDFFRNYASFAGSSKDEMRRAWQCYIKAQKQISYNPRYAWWQYMAGKRIKTYGKTIVRWV